MKTYCLFVTGLLFMGSLHAQNPISMQNELKGLSASRGNVNTTTISEFNNTVVKGARYLFNDWSSGSITDINNTTYGDAYTYNFDKINQDLYARYKGDANISVLIDKSSIRTFTIGSFHFVNSTLLKLKVHDVFYQVLVDDPAKVSLYKLTTTRFIKANPTDMMNIKSGNFGSEYVDDIKYFIIINNGEFKRVSLSEGGIKKALNSMSEKAAIYLNLNEAENIDEHFLVGLIHYVDL